LKRLLTDEELEKRRKEVIALKRSKFASYDSYLDEVDKEVKDREIASSIEERFLPIVEQLLMLEHDESRLSMTIAIIKTLIHFVTRGAADAHVILGALRTEFESKEPGNNLALALLKKVTPTTRAS